MQKNDLYVPTLRPEPEEPLLLSKENLEKSLVFRSQETTGWYQKMIGKIKNINDSKFILEDGT